MSAPSYSIIIPVYNAEKVVKRIVGQILAAQFTDFEIILVDDGSRDKSLTIIKQLSQKDQRIKVIHQENAGPSAARNTGLKAARGHYIIFCDADDEVKTEAFSRVLERFSKWRAGDMIVLSWEIVRKDTAGKITSRRTLAQPEQEICGEDVIPLTIKSVGDDGRMYNLWNKIYDAEIIRQHHLTLRKDLRFGEDLLFNLDYVKHVQKIYFSDIEPFYVYEEDSATSIVSVTRLNYQLRWQNILALEEFAKAKDSQQVQDNLMLFRWRSLVSYVLAVCGSQERFFEQSRRVKQAIKHQQLRPRNVAKKMARKWYIMELILYILINIPFAMLLAMKFSLFIKRCRHNHDLHIQLGRV